MSGQPLRSTLLAAVVFCLAFASISVRAIGDKCAVSTNVGTVSRPVSLSVLEQEENCRVALASAPIGQRGAKAKATEKKKATEQGPRAAPGINDKLKPGGRINEPKPTTKEIHEQLSEVLGFVRPQPKTPVKLVGPKPRLDFLSSLRLFDPADPTAVGDLRGLVRELGTEPESLSSPNGTASELERLTAAALKGYAQITDAAKRSLVDHQATNLVAGIGFPELTSKPPTGSMRSFQAFHSLPATGVMDAETADTIARDWAFVRRAQIIAVAQQTGASVPSTVSRLQSDVFASITDRSRTLILANPAAPELIEFWGGLVFRYAKGEASLERFRALTRSLETRASDDAAAPPIPFWEDAKRAFSTTRVTLGSGQRPATQIALARRDPSHQLTQTLLDLNSRGDAIAITTPSGRHVLIDSGLTHEAAMRIGEVLPPDAFLSIVLTHPDADHIGNIVRLSRDNRLKIDELMMSSYETDTQTRQNLVAELEGLGYERQDLPGAAISMWRHQARSGLQFTRVPLSPAIGKQDSKISLFTATIEQGVTVSVMQLRRPRSSNESSILISISQNGHVTLHAGDANGSVMRELSKHYKLQAQFRPTAADRSFTPMQGVLTLRADTFKWPHHAWLPTTEGERAELAEFLTHVNPTRVLISVGPEDLRGQSVEAVKQFLKDKLPNADVLVTRDDGHIQLTTELLYGIFRGYRLIAEVVVDAA